MKHTYSFLILSALIFSGAVAVYAQDSETNEVKPEKRERALLNIDIKARIEAEREAAKLRKEALQEARQSINTESKDRREALRGETGSSTRAVSQEKRVEFQKRNAERKIKNTERVISATIERLEKIIVRIESRVAKLKADGAVTAEAEGFISAAKVNLVDARASVSAFGSIDLSSETAQENYERIRTSARETREHIRKAHENLMKAVRSLKAVDRPEDSSNSESEND